MSITERIAQLGESLPGPSCTLGKLIDHLDHTDPDAAAELLGLCDDKNTGTLKITWQQLADCINAEHHTDFNTQSLRHHSQGRCACPRRGIR